MILCDGVHVVSDIPGEEGQNELHTFARKIGLRRAWFQDHPVHPHYDVTVAWRVRRAYAAGARAVSAREIAAMFAKRNG